MRIKFSPMRSDDHLTLSRAEDVLTINGEAFDFSGIVEGVPLLRDDVVCDWLASDVKRIAGEIHLALILPHGPDAPSETLFPAPIDAGNGPARYPTGRNIESSVPGISCSGGKWRQTH